MNEVKKRSFALYLLLSILTCGIYGIVVFCQMGDDINKICYGDNKEQCSYIVAWLLGLVTLGIYPLYWFYTAIQRLNNNGYRYGVNVKHDQTDYLLWYLLGAFIVVGPIIAVYHFFDDVNQFADVYGRVEAAPYSQDPAQRVRPQQQPINSGSYHPNNNYVNNEIDPTGPTDSYGNNRYQRGKIMGLSGMYAGTDIPIVHDEIVKIGKDPSCVNIVIEDDFISSFHCSVKYNAINNCYIVTDCSTNGTFLQDGKRLNKNIPTNVPVGSVIYIANRQNGFKLN